MAGGLKIVGLVHGFAAVVGVALALVLAPTPSVAQILDPPGGRPEPRRPASLLRPTLPDDTGGLTEEDRRAFDSGQFGPNEMAPAAQAAVGAAEDGVVDPGDEFSQVVDPAVMEEAAAEAGITVGEGATLQGEEAALRRSPPQDGDPVPVIEEAAPQDGNIEVGDRAIGAAVSEDITEADIRSPEDIRVFAGESGGYDPFLLQADEINPVFSPSTFQGFAFDPFPPIGTKIGSFVLFTALESDYDYNSNLFASPEGVGDSSLEVRPSARLASNWSRHALELRASGDLSFHDRYASEDDRAYLVEGLGRLDVTSDTNLQGLIAHEYGQESRSAINAESAGTRPNIDVTRFRGAFNHTFNRLSVQLRGNIIDTSYSTNIFDGQVQSNADRDYTLYEQAIRPRWEFSPYLFAFADIAFNQRDYNIAAFTDGILRSSTGERYRAGVSFGDVSQILRGTISLGYGHQELDNHLLPPVDGLLIDSDLAWLITPVTVLQVTASSEVAETTTADSPGVMERNYGLELRHSFTKYFVGTAGLGYMTRNFVGTDISDEQFSAGVGTEYYMNPWAVLFTRYQHTDFQSSQPQSSYLVDEVQAGLRLRH